MVRRVISLCLATAIIVTLLAGCGGAQQAPAPAAGTGAGTAEAGTAEAGTAGGGERPPQTDEERWHGPFDEPVVVRMAAPINAALVFPDGDSYAYNTWTRAWAEYLNIHVDLMWEATDADSAYETRLNLSIASGDIPDIINFPNFVQFENMRAARQLTDLQFYFDNYAYPRLVQNMTADGGEALSWGHVDGMLLGLPHSPGINRTTARMLYIRRDWFEETGLPLPNTIEEFFTVARAMQDLDPDNRFAIGQNSGLFSNNMADMTGVANAFGFQPRAWDDDGMGGLVYGTLDDRMVYVLQIYADLFAEGRIDPAFTTLDGGMLGEQLTSNRIAAQISAVWLAGWPLATLWLTDQVDWIIMPVPPSATNPNPVLQQVAAPQGRLVSVRQGFEHPEALMKILNFSVAMIEDPDLNQVERFHPHHMETPLYIKWYDPLTNFNTQINLTNYIRNNRDESFLQSAHDWQVLPPFVEWFDAVEAGQVPSEGSWASWKTWYGDDSGYGVLNYYVDNNRIFVSRLIGYQTDTMLTSWATLIDLENTFLTEVVTGQRPVSDFHDFFVPTWLALGGEQITREVNEWWAGRQ